ncbi:DUF488 domain-containing protein [Jiangella alkaliphila]|uniref:Uncharacterized conserved protein YeaO, DUF488 family n=1 Tax=Jiangella alkaliphila TaxID=419479 RepID=A0A1H2LBW5_9ACTN|nr:DUF488 family protein [Jiangella alkaliphila]SDU78304.1 Uncharacterized conserved protein YeaO, DUF488 family [Jiangella alkaliphila]
MEIRTKRVYDDPEPTDGFRVLVDRLWPRGMSKERADLGLWARDVAPSSALRDWFAHRADRFAEFTARYRAELDENPAVGELLATMRPHATVTLLYGARDRRLNQAAVLADYLRERSAGT